MPHDPHRLQGDREREGERERERDGEMERRVVVIEGKEELRM